MDCNGIYAFDEADAELSLLPMAARRALDAAGLHLSLAAWQRLPLSARHALVRQGAQHIVDVAAVHNCLNAAGAATRAQPPIAEPDPFVLDSALVSALGPGRPITAERWSALRALDRYVLARLAGRGKLERLARAYAEIAAAADGGG